jgi:hypothetical protein
MKGLDDLVVDWPKHTRVRSEWFDESTVTMSYYSLADIAAHLTVSAAGTSTHGLADSVL